MPLGPAEGESYRAFARDRCCDARAVLEAVRDAVADAVSKASPEVIGQLDGIAHRWS